MKRLRKWLFAVLCIAILTVCTAAAVDQANTMNLALTVDKNGNALAQADLQLTFPEAKNSFTINLGPNVSRIHVDGYDAKVSRSGGQSSVTVSSDYGLPTELTLRLSYTIRNTVQPGSDTQSFCIRLLGGLPDADIGHFAVSVKMPRPFSAIPEFFSGYYSDSIDNYLTINVSDDGVLTADATETMLAGETLDLKLETEPDYFTLHNVAGRTLLMDKIAMIVLALLGAVYWWRTLRCRIPRADLKSQAPMGVEPGVAGMLMVGEETDLALMVLNWAASGYLRVSRLCGGSALFSQLIPMGNERSAYEQAVFSRLFSRVSDVTTDAGSWISAWKKADQSAKAYWRSRLFERGSGNPLILRAIAVLMCAFAALSCADRVVPSISLRPLPLAAFTLLGIVWGIVLQYALYRLPMRRKKLPAALLALCLALMIVAWRLTGDKGALLSAAAYSALTGLALLFGPRRKENGVSLLSDLLGWRRYLRTLKPAAAQQHLKADPQYYYKTLLFAEALGVGKRFTAAFDNCRLDECAFFEHDENPMPRQAVAFRAVLLQVLQTARGETPKGERKSASKDRPRRIPPADAANHERSRNNNPRRRTVEVYEPDEN